MGRGEPKLVDDFLVPHLDNGTFAPYLMWLNRQEMIFDIAWNHQNGGLFTKEQAKIFIEYERLKNRQVSYDEKDISHAKQRFRSALDRLPFLIKLPSSKNLKRYKIDPGYKSSRAPKKPTKATKKPRKFGMEYAVPSFIPSSPESVLSVSGAESPEYAVPSFIPSSPESVLSVSGAEYPAAEGSNLLDERMQAIYIEILPPLQENNSLAPETASLNSDSQEDTYSQMELVPPIHEMYEHVPQDVSNSGVVPDKFCLLDLETQNFEIWLEQIRRTVSQ